MVLIILVLVGAFFIYRHYDNWRESSQDVPILAAARHYGVPPALVKAVVWRESRFDPRARGTKGELGLMQVMPGAAAKEWADAERARDFSPRQLLNPATNTIIGAWYLERLLKRYAQTDNPVAYALADYNAGRKNVLKWQQGGAATNSEIFLRQMTFPGTRDYVNAIERRYEHYRTIFPPKD